MHTSQFLNNDGWFLAVTDIWCTYRNYTKHLLQGEWGGGLCTWGS